MRIPSASTDRKIYFVAVDSTDLKTRETGLSSFTVYRSRDGGAATAYTTPTVAELSAANMPGVYCLTLDEDTTLAAGHDTEEYCVHITQASMAPVTRVIELYRPETTEGQTATVANGAVDADIERIQGTVIATPATAGYLYATIKDGTGTGEIDTASGRVAITEAQIDQIVDEVWDELKSAHTVADSFGDYLDDEITSRTTTADIPTTSAIADQVWDEALAGHLSAGSTGAALNAAGAAGDPWSTALPGAYGAGTAGKIIGDNVNATISSRASQSSLDTVDDFLDTEIAAIKAKTDQLTFTNANKVDSSLQAAGDVLAAVANKIADHVLRRTYANARASSDGDAVTFRSLLGGLSKLVNKWYFSGSNLLTTHEDDSTAFGSQAVTSDAAAEPITSLDTN